MHDERVLPRLDARRTPLEERPVVLVSVLELVHSFRPTPVRPAVLLSAALLVFAGCANDQGYRLSQKRDFGNGHVMQTKADTRLVIESSTPYDAEGNRRREQVVCAEPSPDVAKAFSTALELAGAAEGAGQGPNLPVEIQAKLAASASLARAEALAQLTNRLATIQLLRDGLYRACEAYANGALSATTYAVLLGRYDDTMVTMLSGELIAGSFGQDLALIGADAGGSATASAGKVAQASEEVTQALDAATTEVASARGAIVEAQKALDTCARQEGAECRAEKDAVLTAGAKVATAEREQMAAMVKAMGAVATATTANARAVLQQGVTGSAAAARSDAATASTTSALQRLGIKFLENLNQDAVMVACLAELSHTPADERGSHLAPLCATLLPQMAALHAEVVRGKLVPGPGPVAADCGDLLRAVFSDPALSNDGNAKRMALTCLDALPGAMRAQTEIALKDAEARRLDAETRRLKADAAAGGPDASGRVRRDEE